MLTKLLISRDGVRAVNAIQRSSLHYVCALNMVNFATSDPGGHSVSHGMSYKNQGLPRDVATRFWFG